MLFRSVTEGLGGGVRAGRAVGGGGYMEILNIRVGRGWYIWGMLFKSVASSILWSVLFKSFAGEY